MHPFLIDIELWGSHLRIPSYGFFLALAFASAYFSSLRRAVKWNLDPRHVENLFLIIVLSSVIGSRLFHVLFEEFGYYLAHPMKVFAVWEGGYTLYGALLSAIFGIFLYGRAKKLPVLQFTDLAAAPTALGIGIGRIGCLLAGCCWGIPTDLPWGITFSHPESFTLVHDQALHPTQLYESIGAFFIYAFLCWRFKHRRYTGQLTFQGLLAYSILRFLVEYLRGDDYRGFLFGGWISYSQLIALSIVPIAIWGMWYFSKKSPVK